MERLSALIRSNVDQLAAMEANSEALIAARLDLGSIIRAVIKRARTVTNAEFSAFSTFDDEGVLERFIYLGMDEDTARRMGKPPVGRGLLGNLVTHEKPFRVDDLQADPRFSGWPVGHPDMCAFLGVPLRAAGETIGALYMTRMRGRDPFSDVDELAAGVLAWQATASINRALARERSDRVFLLEERVRIAHDLHDGTIQSLYALGLHTDTLANREDFPPEASEQLRTNVQRINALIAEIRDYIESLEHTAGEATPELSRDLTTTVRQIVPSGVDTIVNITAPALAELGGRASEDLLFIAREAVSNAVRHGKPSRIAVDLRQTAEETALTVQDDGVGFDTANSSPGLGTVTMRTRAAHLEASLMIHSVPGMGTTIRVAIPRSVSDD